MKVKFTTNLGSRDASRAGLDYHDCVADAVLDIPEAVAEVLCKRGVAIAVDSPKTKAKAAEPPTVEEPPELPEPTESVQSGFDPVGKKHKR